MSFLSYGSSFQSSFHQPYSGGYQQPNQSGNASGYRRMIRMAARMFYGGDCPPADRDPERDNPRSKIAKMNTRGLAVVVLDYLTRGEWHNEETVLKDLQLNPKLLRKALQFLEQEQLIQSYDKRDKRRKARAAREEAEAYASGRVSAAAAASLAASEAAAAAASESSDEDNESGRRGHLYSYFAVDYSRAHDALKLKMHRMRARFDGGKPKLVQYFCPSPMCGRRSFSSLDAAALLGPDGILRCFCGTELCEAGEGGGDDAVGGVRGRGENQRERQRAVKEAVAPLENLLRSLRDAPPPDVLPFNRWIREKQVQQQAQMKKHKEAEAAAEAAAKASAASTVSVTVPEAGGFRITGLGGWDDGRSAAPFSLTGTAAPGASGAGPVPSQPHFLQRASLLAQPTPLSGSTNSDIGGGYGGWSAAAPPPVHALPVSAPTPASVVPSTTLASTAGTKAASAAGEDEWEEVSMGRPGSAPPPPAPKPTPKAEADDDDEWY